MWNDTYQLTQLPISVPLKSLVILSSRGYTLSGVDSHEDEDLHMKRKHKESMSLIALNKHSLIKTHLNPLT